MGKKTKKKNINKSIGSYFFASPTWWGSLIVLFIWFIIPEYSGIKPIISSLFGVNTVGKVAYIIIGLIVAAGIFLFGVDKDKLL